MEIYRTRKVYGKFDDVKSFVSVFFRGYSNRFLPCGSRILIKWKVGDFPLKKEIRTEKKVPGKFNCQGLFGGWDYFLQEQPQPDDFAPSCFCMVPVSVHSGHFLGLHLPSLVAPHFSHLNTAILYSSVEINNNVRML